MPSRAPTTSRAAPARPTRPSSRCSSVSSCSDSEFSYSSSSDSSNSQSDSDCSTTKAKPAPRRSRAKKPATAATNRSRARSASVAPAPSSAAVHAAQHHSHAAAPRPPRTQSADPHHTYYNLPYVNRQLPHDADRIRIDVPLLFNNSYYLAPLAHVFERVQFLTDHFGMNEGTLAEQARINTGVFSRMKTNSYPHDTRVYYEAFLRNAAACLELRLVRQISEAAAVKGVGHRRDMLQKFQRIATQNNHTQLFIGNDEFDAWFNITLPLDERKRIDLLLMEYFSIDDPSFRHLKKSKSRARRSAGPPSAQPVMGTPTNLVVHPTQTNGVRPAVATTLPTAASTTLPFVRPQRTEDGTGSDSDVSSIQSQPYHYTLGPSPGRMPPTSDQVYAAAAVAGRSDLFAPSMHLSLLQCPQLPQ